jgi:hypothetical protein
LGTYRHRRRLFVCAFYPWRALFVLTHGKGIVRLLTDERSGYVR